MRFKGQVMSPLGKAIDSMVERLEAAKVQGGLAMNRTVGTGAVDSGEAGTSGISGDEASTPVGDLTRTYNELKKSFALCGITIDPPFPTPDNVIERMDDMLPDTSSETEVPPHSPNERVPPPPAPARRLDGPDLLGAKTESPARPLESKNNSGLSPTSPECPPTKSPKAPALASRQVQQAGKSSTSNDREDVVVVAIKLARDREAHIRVQKGDSSLQLARDFVAREHLPDDEATVRRLAKLIDDKIERFVQTIPSLTKAKLKAAFQLFDKDKDKMISRTQLKGLLASLGIQCTEQMVQNYFKARNPKTAVPSLLDMKTFEEVSAEYFQLPAEPQEPRVLSGNSSLVSTPSQYSTGSSNLGGARRPPGGATSVRSSSSTGSRGKLIAELDIQLGTSGKTGKIVVRRGDDGQDLVTQFCRKYPGQLTARQAQSLVVQLNRRLYPQQR